MFVHLSLFLITISSISACNLDCAANCSTINCISNDCNCNLGSYQQFIKSNIECVSNQVQSIANSTLGLYVEQLKEDMLLAIGSQSMKDCSKVQSNLLSLASSDLGCYNSTNGSECANLYSINMYKDLFSKEYIKQILNITDYDNDVSKQAFNAFVDDLYDQYQQSQEYIASPQLQFQESKVYEFIVDLKKLQFEYANSNQKFVESLKSKIEYTYKNLKAQFYVNYAKTFYPVTEAYLGLLKSLTPLSSDCNASCVADNCIGQDNEFYCMKDICHCEYNYTAIKYYSEIYLAKDLEADLAIEKLIQNVSVDFKGSFNDLQALQDAHMNQFIKFISKQAIVVAKCNASCVENCTNSNLTFFDLPQCFQTCQCQDWEQLLNSMDFDIDSLARYAKEYYLGLQYYQYYIGN